MASIYQTHLPFRPDDISLRLMKNSMDFYKDIN